MLNIFRTSPNARATQLEAELRGVEEREQTALEMWLRSTPTTEIDQAFATFTETIDAIKMRLRSELVVARMEAMQ